MNLCPRRLSNANLLESEATAGIEPAMKVFADLVLIFAIGSLVP